MPCLIQMNGPRHEGLVYQQLLHDYCPLHFLQANKTPVASTACHYVLCVRAHPSARWIR